MPSTEVDATIAHPTTAAPPRQQAIAARVTANIIEALQNGVRPWVQPWDRATALALPLRSNGIPYRGFNVLALWACASERQFAPRHWLTLRQANALDAHVRRGERATHITYYADDTATRDTATDATPADNKAQPQKRRTFLRTYAVFNAAQIDNLPAHFYATPAPIADCDAAQLDDRFARVPATITHGGARACYNPATDTIHLPPRHSFIAAAQYFATLLHELAHWTGHATRLARDLHPRSSATAYAREELVAELTAAFLGAELGLPVEHLECHASYLDHWLAILDREPAALLAAAGHAQRAADLLRPFLFPEPTAPAA